MLRLLAFASVLVVVGVYTPRLAPGLVAGFTADPPVAEASPAVEPAPPKVAAPRLPAADDVALSPRRVALLADTRGHFSTNIVINGRQIPVMIDTGATLVAINEATAAKVGLRPPKRAYTAEVSTASGVIKAAP